MRFVEFAAHIRANTKTDSVTFTDTEILRKANIYKDEIAAEITKANEDYFGREMYRDLVADQRGYSEPDDLLNQIKRVEAKIDGSTWQKLDEFDLNSYAKTTDESSIRSQFAGVTPQFDIFNRTLFLYSGDPIIDVTEGLKLWAILYPADFTDLTLTTDMAIDPTVTSAGLPRQFHELLARRVAIDYKNDNSLPLTQRDQRYEQDLANAVDLIGGGNLDRVFVASMDIPDGDGEDL